MRDIEYIKPKEAKEKLDKKALFIDIRNSGEKEYIQFDVENILYLTDLELLDELQNLDKKMTYIIVDFDGTRTFKAHNMLLFNDFESVYSLEGGLKAWNAEGFEIKYNVEGGCSEHHDCGSCGMNCC